MKDYLGYKGKVCVVSGAASGIGKELVAMLMNEGALVYALDFRVVEGVTKFIKVNLADKEEIDSAISKLPQKIDKFFSNAAAPGIFYGKDKFTTEEVVAINYGAGRYLVEQLSERMDEGAAICITSSCVGHEWKTRMDIYSELFEKYSTFEESKKWAKKFLCNKDTCLFPEQFVYGVTKEALTYFAKRISFDIQKKGIRLNISAPGAVDTVMTPDFNVISEFYGDTDFAKGKPAINPNIDRAATAYEQALALLFINSDMAVTLSGVSIATDFGFTNALLFNRCTPMGEFV